MDRTFRHRYETEELTEGPGFPVSHHYYYPGALTSGGRDGVLVRICPDEGPPWLATFAFGEFAPESPLGIFTTPDPHRLCVVAKGPAYFVSANDPTSWEEVCVTPVLDIRPIRNSEIMVFADFTQLVAYGATGMKWKTKRLSWDGLKIGEVTDTSIKGEYWDFRSDRVETFVVDLATGTNRGGVEEGRP